MDEDDRAVAGAELDDVHAPAVDLDEAPVLAPVDVHPRRAADRAVRARSPGGPARGIARSRRRPLVRAGAARRADDTRPRPRSSAGAHAHRHRHRLHAAPLLAAALRRRQAPLRHRAALRPPVHLGDQPPAQEQLRVCVDETALRRGDPAGRALPARGRDRQPLARGGALHPHHEPPRRPCHPATKTWLDAIGLEYDELYCSYDKVGRCREIGIDVLIDDSPVNIVRAIEAGMTAATIRHPWNDDVCEEEEVICARDWPELARALEPLLDARPPRSDAACAAADPSRRRDAAARRRRATTGGTTRRRAAHRRAARTSAAAAGPRARAHASTTGAAPSASRASSTAPSPTSSTASGSAARSRASSTSRRRAARSSSPTTPAPCRPTPR